MNDQVLKNPAQSGANLLKKEETASSDPKTISEPLHQIVVKDLHF